MQTQGYDEKAAFGAIEMHESQMVSEMRAFFKHMEAKQDAFGEHVCQMIEQQSKKLTALEAKLEKIVTIVQTLQGSNSLLQEPQHTTSDYSWHWPAGANFTAFVGEAALVGESSNHEPCNVASSDTTNIVDVDGVFTPQHQAQSGFACQQESCQHPDEDPVLSLASYEHGSSGGSTVESASNMETFHKQAEELGLAEGSVCNVMIKNIPCSCTKEDVLQAIADLGFGNHYFFHMPVPGGAAGRRYNLGYAFVGFTDEDVTSEFVNAMTGYRFYGKRGRNSEKECMVVPARAQGFQSTMNLCKGRRCRKSNPTFSM